jgi:hypothetical protein
MSTFTDLCQPFEGSIDVVQLIDICMIDIDSELVEYI